MDVTSAKYDNCWVSDARRRYHPEYLEYQLRTDCHATVIAYITDDDCPINISVKPAWSEATWRLVHRIRKRQVYSFIGKPFRTRVFLYSCAALDNSGYRPRHINKAVCS